MTSLLYSGLFDLNKISARGRSRSLEHLAVSNKYSQRQTESVPIDTSDKIIETILPASVSRSGILIMRGGRVNMRFTEGKSNCFEQQVHYQVYGWDDTA